MIPDAELLVGTYLREHPDVEALGAKVVGGSLASSRGPWVRLTQIGVDNTSATTQFEHLTAHTLQLDCFAGGDATTEHRGQAEANELAGTVRDALVGLLDADLPGYVVARVMFTNHVRIPDTSREPAVERIVLEALVSLHP